MKKQNKEVRIFESTKAKETVEAYNLLTILKKEKVEFGSNNLILAPVGSGKTYVIVDLIKKLKESGVEKPALNLVSTTSLRKSVINDLSSKHGLNVLKKVREIQDLTDEEINNIILTDKEKGTVVMTYAKLGSELIGKLGMTYIENFSDIFCDEIHSLFDYVMTFRSPELFFVVHALMKKYDNRRVFYFTATAEKMDKFTAKYPDLMENITEENTYNYLEREDIVRYVPMFVKKYNILADIEKFLTGDNLDFCVSLQVAFKMRNIKGIVFTEKIDDMPEFITMLERLGFTSIALWSENNKAKPMNDKQRKVMKQLLEVGTIPNEYDFIIYNGALREGWNLNDMNVKVAIMNTTDSTNYVQALGRARKQVELVFELTRETLEQEKIVVPEDALNVPMIKEDVVTLIEKMNIRYNKGNNKGKLVTSTMFFQMARESGYLVETGLKARNNENKRVNASLIKKA